jgi:hypothetical protein
MEPPDMSDVPRSRAPWVCRSSGLRRRLGILDEACAELNPVLAFVAIGLALNLLFVWGDPELTSRALIGMRMSGDE